MSEIEQNVSDHYSRGGLYDRIIAALAKNGISQNQIKNQHLKAVDEFHMGGAPATEHLLDPLALGPTHAVLDVGCGIGGAVRHIASTYGAHVTGVDLTPDYIATAERLSQHLGVQAEFVVGSALELPFDPNQFDVATLLHVGMNIEDKGALFRSVGRVLKPGGVFAVYDVMLFGSPPEYPTPWASELAYSFLEGPSAYLDAAGDAGFTLLHHEDRGEIAKEFFRTMQAQIAEHGPPVVGPPLMMGDAAPTKIENLTRAVNAGGVQPVEMVFRLAD